MNAALESVYGRRVPDIEAAAVAGPAPQCADEVARAMQAGAELILFTTMFDHAAQAARLAADVMPQFSPGA
jgi:hypothetical protein